MEKWTDTALRLLFPPRCALCDGLLSPEELAGGIHSACRPLLPFVGEQFCMHCGQPLEREEQEYCFDCARKLASSLSPERGRGMSSNIAQGRGVFEYRGAVRQAMYRFKYSNRREYANFLAAAACERWGSWIRASGVEAVVPVPMYRGKERRRGYNQAGLFGKALAERMDLAYVPDAVVRVRNTRPQKELNDEERKNNLKNAFQIAKYIVQYRKVLLVDDIYTTGSTAEAVAELLRSMGVARVYFLAVCIGRGF